MFDKKKTISFIFGGLFIIVLGLGDGKATYIPNNVKLITGFAFLIVGLVSLTLNYINSKKNK